MAEVLLKARPTERQLADRLGEPVPPGLELYLDQADLRDQVAMRAVLERLSPERLPAGFVLIVEGPIRSLDGQFFHVARGSEADAEVVRRLLWLGERLGAQAINLHFIAPGGEECLRLEARTAALERSLSLLSSFADGCASRGMVPTVENMPPVLRMRQGGFFHSAIGMLPEDFLWLAERAPSLRVCLDVSHAQLVVNAQRRALNGEDEWPGLYAFLRRAAPLEHVGAFLHLLEPYLYSAHISNASEVIGEGRPYDQGDLDLDPLIRRLARSVRFLVTETLEPDPDHARYMREAQRRMLAALEAADG